MHTAQDHLPHQFFLALSPLLAAAFGGRGSLGSRFYERGCLVVHPPIHPFGRRELLADVR